MSPVLKTNNGATSVTRTPSKPGSSSLLGAAKSPHPDRFIPNRHAMDLDHAHYNLTGQKCTKPLGSAAAEGAGKAPGSSANPLIQGNSAADRGAAGHDDSADADEVDRANHGDIADDVGSRPAGGDAAGAAGGGDSGPGASSGSAAGGDSSGVPGSSSGPGSGADAADRGAENGGYASTLAASMMLPRESKVLAFKPKPPTPKKGYTNEIRVLYSQNQGAKSGAAKKAPRHIPQVPERVLDAPELLDDYYLNLLDWSQTNVLAVALRDSVYLWNATDGTIQQLLQMSDPNNYVASVSWSAEGSYLAVGTSTAEVQLWDVSAGKKIRNMKGHQARVGSLAWNNWMLSSGSRDSTIHNHDVRAQQHHIATLEGHTQEVCGLRWSADGAQLASGGNDNLLHIWDSTSNEARFKLEHHQAAVKAVAWAPWQNNLLASGGGTADRCIKIWNTTTGACLNSVDTESQVCALQWSKNEKELVSSHGYSQNQLCVWKYPSMAKIAELTAHTSRVLHMSQSPDGSTIVSGGADETLRFWNLGYQAATTSKKHIPSGGFSGMNIR